MTSPVEVWLWLLLVMQPDNPKTNRILSENGGDATKAAKAIRDDNLPILSDSEKKRAVETRNGAVQRVLKICEDNSIRIVTLDSEDYPPLLRNIPDPPIVLFVKGSLAGLKDKLVISAVGTKRPSDYSVSATEMLIKTLSKIGAVAVSGNAGGLDSAVHKACISCHGRSVAVLPCGILADYPRGGKELKNAIVDNGGAVVSELLPYTNAFIGYFHRRNRIISGMSEGTIVLQAGEKSGSLSTANCAFSQNRTVFYIPPHDIFSKEYSGAAILAKKNAVPVFDVSDITDALLKDSIRIADITQKIKSLEFAGQKPDKPPKPKKEETAKAEEAADITENLSDEEKALVEIIKKAPADIDALIDKSGLDYETAIDTLTVLELSKVIERQMDGNYALFKQK